MEKCIACKKIALMPTIIGKATFCQSCALKLNYLTWKDRNFYSLEELLEKRDTTLALAEQHSFSEDSKQLIMQYFGNYINDGFVMSINGKTGQFLKVFKDYILIETKDENAINAMHNLLYHFSDDNDYDDEDDEENTDFLSVLSSEKKNIVKGVVSGKLIQTGVGIVAASVIDQKEKEKNSEKIEQKRIKKSRARGLEAEKLVRVGEMKIQYQDIVKTFVFSNKGCATGCLTFVLSNSDEGDFASCKHFLFDNNKMFETKKIKQKLEIAAEYINNKSDEIAKVIQKEKEELENKLQNQNQLIIEEKVETVSDTSKPSVFDEIRMYKQLLDEGILTQEEFDLKKKQLLGL